MSARKAKAPRHHGPTMIQRSRAVSAAEKAGYHQVSGAGKPHVKRRFFGLTSEDEDAIVNRIERALDQAVKEA